MSALQWHRLGRVYDLKTKPLQQIQAGEVVLALSYRDGEFGAISGRCNHAGGPLGHGQVDADGYVVCPWHHWHFHRLTGQAHAGIPAAAPRYDLNFRACEVYYSVMEENVAGVQPSIELHDGARALANRCVAMAADLIAAGEGPAQIERGGRKAHPSP